VLTQDTPVRLPTLDGTDSDVQVAPPSVVPMTAGLPKNEKPTAVQSDTDGQAIEFNPLTDDGMTCGLHAYPLFVEARMESMPTAKQSALLGQETEFRAPTPTG
jgi:hypothetical protein